MKIENWKLSDIKPYWHNSKQHNVSWIVASIREFKVDQPIVVDGEGVIIKGHGRLAAAAQLEMDTFPVVVRDDLTPDQVRLSRIADNRSGEGGWDVDMLLLDMADMGSDAVEISPADVGVDQAWMAGLAAALEKETNKLDLALDDLPDPGSDPTDTVKMTACPKCGFQFGVK